MWSNGGTLLASATFTSETASGWQEVIFANAVPVTANTTYVVSYFAPQGHYSFDAGYFASSGVSNSPLQALQDGTDGANGVYSYNATSTFPNSTSPTVCLVCGAFNMESW
jgi:hypothetical protein